MHYTIAVAGIENFLLLCIQFNCEIRSVHSILIYLYSLFLFFMFKVTSEFQALRKCMFSISIFRFVSSSSPSFLYNIFIFLLGLIYFSRVFVCVYVYIYMCMYVSPRVSGWVFVYVYVRAPVLHNTFTWFCIFLWNSFDDDFAMEKWTILTNLIWLILFFCFKFCDFFHVFTCFLFLLVFNCFSILQFCFFCFVSLSQHFLCSPCLSFSSSLSAICIIYIVICCCCFFFLLLCLNCK